MRKIARKIERKMERKVDRQKDITILRRLYMTRENRNMQIYRHTE